MTAKDERFFSKTANCYGFAVKRKTTSYGDGTAVPGGVRTGEKAGAYIAALKEGILKDGGSKIAFRGQFAAKGLAASNIPSAGANRYLIALLTKGGDGFHFLRRQQKKAIGEPFWKWKEGNEGLEERNAVELPKGNHVRVTDARFPALVDSTLWGLRSSPYDQVLFFEVDVSGFDI
jgi:hypothetical protein